MSDTDPTGLLTLTIQRSVSNVLILSLPIFLSKKAFHLTLVDVFRMETRAQILECCI